jgi:3-deoxy-7-phosphoheptulonate synthase
MKKTQDLHVIDFVPLIPPIHLKNQFAMSEKVNQTVFEGRQTIKRMLRNKDKRLLVIVGPCSIHDEASAIEYAEKLAQLQRELNDRLVIVMRVYLEKPRTTVGWKGLIYDPFLDGSGDMHHGLRQARQIMLKICEMGLPTATEFLDPIVPQYIDDLVSWAAIGARTTESQTHREMSSGLSMPFGFKNTTSGDMQIAIDAMRSARASHNFIGVTPEGQTAIVKTSGNVWGHVIMRGGSNGTNYDRDSVKQATDILKKHKLPEYVMIDCSHANSNKDFSKQEAVLNDVIKQRADGNDLIFGVMLESHLNEGNQSLSSDLSNLKHGVSITDGCMNWETTERILRDSYNKLEGVCSRSTE